MDRKDVLDSILRELRQRQLHANLRIEEDKDASFRTTLTDDAEQRRWFLLIRLKLHKRAHVMTRHRRSGGGGTSNFTRHRGRSRVLCWNEQICSHQHGLAERIGVGPIHRRCSKVVTTLSPTSSAACFVKSRRHDQRLPPNFLVWQHRIVVARIPRRVVRCASPRQDDRVEFLPMAIFNHPVSVKDDE